MHGALDDNGKWIEGLNENSTYWIHQWRKKGSQPGIGLKETCQFLITKSTDDGLTWSFPDNITGKTKRLPDKGLHWQTVLWFFLRRDVMRKEPHFPILHIVKTMEKLG